MPQHWVVGRGHSPGCPGHPGLFCGAGGGMLWSVCVCPCCPVCSQPWASWLWVSGADGLVQAIGEL